jgi:hypothetical protein
MTDWLDEFIDTLDDIVDAIFSGSDRIYDTRVTRNRDKPHRCPRCHAVAFRGCKALHAWTVISCHRCEVWWRYGPRWTTKLGNRWHAVRQARWKRHLKP